LLFNIKKLFLQSFDYKLLLTATLNYIKYYINYIRLKNSGVLLLELFDEIEFTLNEKYFLNYKIITPK
jgi:hypothetical protein